MYRLCNGVWEKAYYTEVSMSSKDTDVKVEYEWNVIPITEVPVDVLLGKWEGLVNELAVKECELIQVKEMFNAKEFEIVYQSDIDFKALYGSTAEKVRKQHASNELKQLKDKQNDLELGIAWIKNYLPFLRETIRIKKE